MLKDIFLPFFRTEPGRNEGDGGTGLGLAIASEAIAIHGGTITAHNRKGGGFEVRMVLPLKSVVREEGVSSSVTVNKGLEEEERALSKEALTLVT
jgi:two-component system sensor histidine kinase CpxA